MKIQYAYNIAHTVYGTHQAKTVLIEIIHPVCVFSLFIKSSSEPGISLGSSFVLNL